MQENSSPRTYMMLGSHDHDFIMMIVATASDMRRITDTSNNALQPNAFLLRAAKSFGIFMTLIFQKFINSLQRVCTCFGPARHACILIACDFAPADDDPGC